MLYNHETVLSEGYAAFGKKYTLVHVPECDELAGSGTRHIMECYRVVYMFDGNRHSKAFKTLKQAQEYFNQYTQPIIEQKA